MDILEMTQEENLYKLGLRELRNLLKELAVKYQGDELGDAAFDAIFKTIELKVAIIAIRCTAERIDFAWQVLHDMSLKVRNEFPDTKHVEYKFNKLFPILTFLSNIKAYKMGRFENHPINHELV